MIVLNTWAIVFFGYALETEHCVQIIDFVDGAFFWRDDNEAISTWFVRGWTNQASPKHNRVVNDVEARFMSSHFAHGTLFDVVMKDGLITITAVNNAGLYLHHVVLVHLTCSAFFCLLTFFSLFTLQIKRQKKAIVIVMTSFFLGFIEHRFLVCYASRVWRFPHQWRYRTTHKSMLTISSRRSLT